MAANLSPAASATGERCFIQQLRQRSMHSSSIESISEAVIHKGQCWNTYLASGSRISCSRSAAACSTCFSVSASVHLIKARRYRDNNHQFMAEYRRWSRDKTSGSVLWRHRSATRDVARIASECRGIGLPIRTGQLLVGPWQPQIRLIERRYWLIIFVQVDENNSTDRWWEYRIKLTCS